LAIRARASLRFSYVRKNGGKIAERGTVTVSSDGRRMTERSWNEGRPDRASKAAYVRSP
jgi:hypothetical protein